MVSALTVSSCVVVNKFAYLGSGFSNMNLLEIEVE